MGKKLTEADKKKVRDYARAHADPSKGQVYRVDVADELTDDGIAPYTILYMTEGAMPKDKKN